MLRINQVILNLQCRLLAIILFRLKPQQIHQHHILPEWTQLPHRSSPQLKAGYLHNVALLELTLILVQFVDDQVIAALAKQTLAENIILIGKVHQVLAQLRVSIALQPHVFPRLLLAQVYFADRLHAFRGRAILDLAQTMNWDAALVIVQAVRQENTTDFEC